MGFDASKLDAIRRIMDEVAEELGRPATTAEVRARAQAEGITSSTGTAHRYMSEIETQRRSKAGGPSAGSNDSSRLPGLDQVAGPLAELHGAVDGFGGKVIDTLQAMIVSERQHFAKTLSDQHTDFEQRLAEASRTIADLEQTIELVIAEAELAKSGGADAAAEVEAAKSQVNDLKARLVEKTAEAHSLEVSVTRLQSEEQRQRESALELRIARTVLVNEITVLKAERDGLRAKLDDVDPLRFALQQWKDYVGRDQDARETSRNIVRPKISLEKK